MTTTAAPTVEKALTKADPNQLADALRALNLGNLLKVKEYDTGTITAVAAVPLPERALAVLSARVVTSGTATSVGTYLVADNGVTPLLPPGGASTAVGIAKSSSKGTSNANPYISTVEFPNTVTRVIFMYIPAPETKLDVAFPAGV